MTVPTRWSSKELDKIVTKKVGTNPEIPVFSATHGLALDAFVYKAGLLVESSGINDGCDWSVVCCMS